MTDPVSKNSKPNTSPGRNLAQTRTRVSLSSEISPLMSARCSEESTWVL